MRKTLKWKNFVFSGHGKYICTQLTARTHNLQQRKTHANILHQKKKEILLLSKIERMKKKKTTQEKIITLVRIFFHQFVCCKNICSHAVLCQKKKKREVLANRHFNTLPKQFINHITEIKKTSRRSVAIIFTFPTTTSQLMKNILYLYTYIPTYIILFICKLIY